MPFFFSNKIYIQDYINNLVGKIFSNDLMHKLNYDLMEDGWQLRKEIKPKKSVITRKISEGRINKSRFYFTKDNDPNILKFYDKKNDTVDEIEKKSLIKTFRTSNGVDTYEITKKFDYHIPKKDIEKNSSYLMIPNRFILIADNMFSTAFYSADKITPLNQFTMYLCPTKKEAKVLCLYFNSIFFIIQILRLAKRSLKEGRFANFIEIKQADLKEIYAPDFEKISKDTMNNLVNYFNRIKNKKKMPIIRQFKDKIQERIDIDLLINDTFNLNFTKIDIEKMYDYIIEELT